MYIAVITEVYTVMTDQYMILIVLTEMCEELNEQLVALFQYFIAKIHVYILPK